MPFDKVGPDDYTGPSGKHFNYAQVKRYYSKGGHFQKGGSVNKYAKGGDIRVAGYAQGGSVLGRTREFLKEKVKFRDPLEGDQNANNADNFYAKSGEGAGKGEKGGPAPKRTGDKCLQAVKPRK